MQGDMTGQKEGLPRQSTRVMLACQYTQKRVCTTLAAQPPLHKMLVTYRSTLAWMTMCLQRFELAGESMGFETVRQNSFMSCGKVLQTDL